MDQVYIYLTDPYAEAMEPFAHDEMRFVFERLEASGPRRLLDGPIWAFVDWVMDDLAGLEMCRRLRANPQTSGAHITMVLEDDDIDGRKRALQAGADDYMVGPLSRSAVLDRVLALTAGRPDRHAIDRFDYGDVVIDMAALRAYWRGRAIDLRPNEFRLLRFLAENANQVLSREELIAGLGKQEPPIDERTVDVWIGRLRRAIISAGGGNPLRTIRSMGYVFDLS